MLGRKKGRLIWIKHVLGSLIESFLFTFLCIANQPFENCLAFDYSICAIYLYKTTYRFERQSGDDGPFHEIRPPRCRNTHIWNIDQNVQETVKNVFSFPFRCKNFHIASTEQTERRLNTWMYDVIEPMTLGVLIAVFPRPVCIPWH